MGTIAGGALGVLTSARLTAYRLQQLENKVAEHNKFARRLPVVEEQINAVNHKLKNAERSESHEK